MEGRGTLCAMENTDEGTATVTITQEETVHDHEPTLRLRLQKPQTSREVRWATDTVDNEGMGKKKSKCCCIYEKPRAFGESSSEDEEDEDCEHCRGHVEKKKKKHHSDPSHPAPSSDPESKSQG